MKTEKAKKMKSISPIVMCLVLSLGCSKKDEECPPFQSAVEKYQQRISSLETELKKQDAAALLEASKAVNASLSDFKSQKTEITAVPLTDEKLLALRKEVTPHLEKTLKLLDEWVTQLLSSAKIETQGNGLNEKIENSKAEIKAVCEKKIRNRRARRKQQKACNKIDPILEKIIPKDLNPEQIDAVKNELVDASNQHDDFKKPSEDIGKTLDGIKALLEKRGKMTESIDSTGKKIDTHRKAFGDIEKNIMSYCAPE